MAAITDLSQLINTLTGGTAAKEQTWFFQDARNGAAAGAATVAGQYTSLWTFNWSPGGTGAAPGGTARNPTNATTGVISYTDPGGGRQKYLAGLAVSGNVAGTFLLYDRLADYSGLSGTTTTAQNTTSLSVSRYTGTESVGNEIWLEIYTIIGTTATTITASYTNQAGTASRTTQAVVFGATNRREATRAIRLPLQAGDTGVRSVESVTVLATTGTAGDFGVTIIRPIAQVTVPVAGTGALQDLVSGLPSLPELKTDAALNAMWYANTTTSPQTFGTLSMVEA